MPKAIMHPMEKPERVHPVRLAWAKLRSDLAEKRSAIMAATGWSKTTFYRKFTGEQALTEHETNVISPLLNVDANDIDAYQGGYKTKRGVA